MTLTKFTRIPLLLTLLAVAVFGSASRSHAGIVYSTTNNSYVNVFTDKETNTTITGMVNNATPEIYIQGFATANGSLLSLDAKSGVASVAATNDSDNLRILTLTAEAGFGISSMNWSLFAKNNTAGTLIFNAYDANNNLIALSSGFNTFDWGNGANQFDFQTDNGSLVSKLEIISSKDIGEIKQISVNTQSIQSVPEPTSTLAFAGVAAMCGLYRLRRRNRKAEK